MFEKVVKDDPSSLQYVPDWFVTGEWACMWYDKSDCWADDEIMIFLNGTMVIKNERPKKQN